MRIPKKRKREEDLVGKNPEAKIPKIQDRTIEEFYNQPSTSAASAQTHSSHTSSSATEDDMALEDVDDEGEDFRFQMINHQIKYIM